MKTITRHAIDRELAEEGVQNQGAILAGAIESSTTRPQAVASILAAARSVAGYLSVVAPDIEPVCAALKTGARAADALFTLATGSGEVELDLGKQRVRMPATGPTDRAHVGRWRVGWWLSHIVCDRGAIDRLRTTPVEVLRRSSTTGDECQYLFAEALQSFEARSNDWGTRLKQALDTTDPDKATLSDEEFVLNILVPEMELLFRFATGDIPAVNETLAFALERHKKYWSKASRKRDPDGFIALGPVAIAAMARKAGIPLQVQSDYLPEALVAGRCCKAS